MGIVVQKFGGTSVADSECIKRVARKAIRCKEEGNQVVLVVSAMGRSTNQMIALAREISANPSPREMDMLLTTGEQVTISLMAMALEDMGHSAISFTGGQAGIVTDEFFGKGKIRSIDTKRMKEKLDQGNMLVVAGFQGITHEGELTTLGRGGSDTTAVALAAALDADVCEIYTDVDGVYTTDPRVVPNARKLEFISYDEMLEMASLGAAVLQPRSVEYAKQYDVKIHVRSSFNDSLGTIVREVSEMEKNVIVNGVAFDTRVAKITIAGVPDIPGVAMNIFNRLAKENINVDMIVQSNHKGDVNDISFTVSTSESKVALTVMEELNEVLKAQGISFDDTVSKISIVGAGMQSNPGVAASMFEALAEADVNIQMISTSEIKVSCIIAREEVQEAVKALHDKFELERK